MVVALLEFLKGPVVRGSILQVLNLYSHHCARERPGVALLLWLWGLQLRGQWRVERVCQQDKLELDLQNGQGRDNVAG